MPTALRDPRFRRFWAAQVIADAGSGVGGIALSLTAVLALEASAMDMGFLSAASNLPVLLLALHAGVWVDRLPRRPILVAANLGRGALLGLVPLAAAAGWLRMEVLWGITFAVGVLTVVFDIAVTSYVPSLVARERLVDANATLQASSAAARVAGAGAGGWLAQAIGAPFALLAYAASFTASAALLSGVRAPGDAGRADRRGVWTEIAEGIGAVWRDPLLRAMVLATMIGALAGQAAIAASTFVLLAARPGPAGIALVVLAQVLFGIGIQTWSVTQLSLRQAATPPHLLGRVNATRRVAVFGIQPAGAVLGGVLGTGFGLHAPLAVAAAVHVIALAAMVASPLRRARETPP